MRFRVLTIHQPYASLIMMGVKQYETRGWTDPYRGELVIHAGTKWGREQKESLNQIVAAFPDHPIIQQLPDHLDTLDYSGQPAYFGAALGVVELTAMYRTELLAPKISALERALGYYAPGRFAWRCERPMPLVEPFPVSGKQGLWTLEIDRFPGEL